MKTIQPSLIFRTAKEFCLRTTSAEIFRGVVTGNSLWARDIVDDCMSILDSRRAGNDPNWMPCGKFIGDWGICST